MSGLPNSVAEGEQYLKYRQAQAQAAQSNVSLLQESTGGIRGLDPSQERHAGNGHRLPEGMSAGGREGFTDFLGKTAVDPINQKEKEEVRVMEDDFNKSLSDFARKTQQLMDDTRKYVQVTAPGGNPYARKIVTFRNGWSGYVTKYGEFRWIPGAQALANMQQRPGCAKPVKVPSDFPAPAGGVLPVKGTPIRVPGVSGELFVGEPVSGPYGEPCGLEGENVQMTMMADTKKMWHATTAGVDRQPGSVATGIDDYQGGNEDGCRQCLTDQGSAGYYCWLDRSCRTSGDANSPCQLNRGNCVAADGGGPYGGESLTRLPGSFGETWSADSASCETKCNETPFCEGYTMWPNNVCELSASLEGESYSWQDANGNTVGPTAWRAALPCKTSSCASKGAQAGAGSIADVDDSRTKAFIGCVRSPGEGDYQTDAATSASPSGGWKAGEMMTSQSLPSTQGLVYQSDLGTNVTREQCFTRALDVQAGAFGLGSATTSSGSGGAIARGMCYVTDQRVPFVAPDGPCGDVGSGRQGEYTQSYRTLTANVPPTDSGAMAYGADHPTWNQYGVTRNGRFVGARSEMLTTAMATTPSGRVTTGVDGSVEGPEWAGRDLDAEVFFDTGVKSGFEKCGVINGGAFIPGGASYAVDSGSCTTPQDLGVPALGAGESYTDEGMPDHCKQVGPPACVDANQKSSPARVAGTCPSNAPYAYVNGGAGKGKKNGCCSGDLGASAVPWAQYCYGGGKPGGMVTTCPDGTDCGDHQSHASIDNPATTWATFYQSYCHKTCTDLGL
jgi:hypothetical protein